MTSLYRNDTATIYGRQGRHSKHIKYVRVINGRQYPVRGYVVYRATGTRTERAYLRSVGHRIALYG